MTRASFYCSKKVRKLHLLQTTIIYSSDLFTYNAKYFQTFLGRNGGLLPSMQKLLSTVHEVACQFNNLAHSSELMFGGVISTSAFRSL